MPLFITKQNAAFMDTDVAIFGCDPEFTQLQELFRIAGDGLAEACRRNGAVPGQAPVFTRSYGLVPKNLIYFVHPEPEIRPHELIEYFSQALAKALEHGCTSVALSVPQEPAAMKVLRELCVFFMETREMQIYLCVPSDFPYWYANPLFSRLSDYLGGHSGWSGFFQTEEDVFMAAPVAREPEEINAPAPQRDGASEGERRPRPQSPMPIGASDREPSSRPKPAPKPAGKPGAGLFRELTEFLKENDAGFGETLFKYIDRTGKKDSEIYKKANIDRKLFSKIRSNPGYNPSKPTAIAFAIALELSLEETQDLIGRAGYSLSHASTFDRIIEYYIMNQNYDIYEINEALFYFDQSLLGC